MEGNLVKDNGPRIETLRFPTHNGFGPEVPGLDSQVQCGAQGQDRYTDKNRVYPILRETETILRDGTSFTNELKKLLNRYSEENKSNTPDFILANFLVNVLDSFNASTQAREKWYGRKTF